MAKCREDIVYRTDGTKPKVSAGVADDDAALVKAYENALKSFQDSISAENVAVTLLESGRQRKESNGVMTTEWTVGSRCRARWSEDGLLYPAVLVCVEGQQGKVKFDVYGNEQELDLISLLPESDEPPQEEPQWTAGSRCRAVWSGDGLVYPALLLSVSGERGRVQFDGYGNEQDLELRALLAPDAPEGRVDAASEVLERDPDGSSNSSSEHRTDACKASAAEEGFSIPALSSCSTAARTGIGTGVRGSKAERKQIHRTPSQRDGPERFLPFPPPPPPPFVWPTQGETHEEGNEADVDVANLSSMLLSWYLCGYHTGYYTAVQHTKAGNVRRVKEKPKSTYKPSKQTH